MHTIKTTLPFLLFLFYLSAKADIAPNPISAPNLSPLGSTSVRMVSEVVSVDLYKNGSTVEVLFEMKNLGKTETVEIGFPIMDFYYGWQRSLFIGQKNEGDRFKVWVDNQPIEDVKIVGFDFYEVSKSNKPLHELKRDILKEDSIKQAKLIGKPSEEVVIGDMADLSITPWYIWHTTFPEGETRRIKVRYSLPAGANKQSNFFNYLLHTGAGWNQTIGKATIRVKIHDIPQKEIQKIKPSGYKKKNNVVSWTFTDFEPTRKNDIYIFYDKEYPLNKRNTSEALIYLDNTKEDLGSIDTQEIASIRIDKDDKLNFPNGVIFMRSKEYEFTLVKEFIRGYSRPIFKELACISTDDYYKNYSLKIKDSQKEVDASYDDLDAIRDIIQTINIRQMKSGHKQIVVRKKEE
ncbi:hypothetical protein [Bacteroides sp. 224]|uniref:hypothetical protein n=1 Tax=Bacteroides sp. 224 TaxID=2302936 RepID=UPI0013D52F61|nr:hypothetical protein [Bacteroides sp. 224]NDV65673.1 hypothetical protein [Bacteroides sp. 224]